MPGRPLPLAAFLLAGGGLLSELAWTRIAGLLFFGDGAFLVVSLAVGGVSLGAAVGAARPRWLTRTGAARAAAAAGLLIHAGSLVALAFGGRLGMPLTLAASLPGFAALGLAAAAVFAVGASHAPRLYRADLWGAAAGAAASLPLLGVLGAPTAALVSGLAVAAGGSVLAGRRAAAVQAVTALTAALVVTSTLTPWPAASAAQGLDDKSLPRELARGGRVLDAAWGTLGLSERLRRADGAEIVYLDGGAGSLVPTEDRGTLWRGDLGRFPFEALRPERVFVVGAGAGLEVAHALETGAERVVAAEVNGGALALARRATFGATDPFADPRVRWHRDEARSVLRRAEGPFDLIALSQAVTRTSEARRLALTENGIYTVEAVRGYLSRLAPGGAVAFELYDEATLTRALATVMAASRERGLSDADALAHVIIVLDGGTAPPTPLLLAFAEAPPRARVVAVARAAEAAGLSLLHLPGLLERPPLDEVAAGTRPMRSVLAASQGVDLFPTRDDAPFFWSFSPGVPPVLRRLLGVLGAAILVGAFLLWAGVRGGPPGARRASVLAGVLGVAFLALEVAALSRAQLLLGHPAAALAVTLGALLAGGGLGAGLARRYRDAWPAVAGAAVVAGGAALAWTWAWPAVAGVAQAAPFAARAAVTAATLAPLGVALGAPFPLLLRRVGHMGAAAVARAWAANGLGSLTGGTAAVALAHLAGFDAALHVAAAGYLVVAGGAAGLGRGGAGGGTG
ncbi:MAG: hypothetical protein U5K81_09350 [Trueperaceae bacterium]|nr:hypothetical protein [Trueperaceae bacterium]